MAAVMAGVVLVACKKENLQIDKVSVEQLRNHSIPVSEHKKLTKEQRLTVVAADAAGAAIGATAALINPIAGLGCAVVMGVSASIAVRKELKEQNNESVAVDGLLPCVDNSNMDNNNNPYDSVGRSHYLLMNAMLANIYTYCDENEQFSSNIAYQNILSLISTYAPFAEGVDSYCSAVDVAGTISILDTITDITAVLNISPSLKQVLRNYISNAQIAGTADAFYLYSIQEESDVANSANYADTEKQIVLSYMATMRWGMWYWNALLENENR